MFTYKDWCFNIIRQNQLDKDGPVSSARVVQVSVQKSQDETIGPHCLHTLQKGLFNSLKQSHLKVDQCETNMSQGLLCKYICVAWFGSVRGPSATLSLRDLTAYWFTSRTWLLQVFPSCIWECIFSICTIYVLEFKWKKKKNQWEPIVNHDVFHIVKPKAICNMQYGNHYQPGSLEDSEVEEALTPVPSTASPSDQTGSFLHVGILLPLILLLHC